MEHSARKKLEAMAKTPEALNRTVEYVAEHLRLFVKPQDRVLICLNRMEPDQIGGIFRAAVERVGAEPVLWGPDLRWKTLLRLAFSTRARVIVGPPLVILGLSKLAKSTGTPLNIRQVVTAGYPCMDWMIEDIIRGLDCDTWGCFDPGDGAIVGGFSCGKSLGVHLRQDLYSLELTDETDGVGRTVLRSVEDPQAYLYTGERGRLDKTPCPCGRESARLVDIYPEDSLTSDVRDLTAQLHGWSSILDYRVAKGQYGLEMELVVFPGEKLPQLPTAAKRVIRPWDPERDIPFHLVPDWENLA